MSSEKETPIEVALAVRMMRLTRKRFQLSDARLVETGIGPGQVPILLDIERMGKCNQRYLAERSQITPATISATLKRMEKNGLIRRTVDETDARASVVTLTEKGSAACERARTVFSETDREMCGGMTDDECRVMIAMLDRMKENIERAMGEDKK